MNPVRLRYATLSFPAALFFVASCSSSNAESTSPQPTAHAELAPGLMSPGEHWLSAESHSATADAPASGGEEPAQQVTQDGPADVTEPELTSPAASDAVQPVSEPPPNEPSAEEDPIPSIIGDVSFSVPSGTFEGELSVSLSTADTSDIRYTTDGQLPTAASPLYAGSPVVLTETTQVRAQGFVGESPIGEPSTGIYIRRTFDTPSDLPIVIMEGFGGGRPQKEVSFGGMADAEPPVPQPWFDLGFMVFEPVNGVASIADPPSLVTRGGYRERGQSSANAEKSPYRVEFWDNYDDDLDYPLLGMPAESDWAMIGEYFDPSQIQNALVYSWGADMGLSTVRVRFAELYINFDGGPLEESDYFGLYMVSETIKNQKNRLDLKQLREEDTQPQDLSGGYIFKFDQGALDGGEPELVCVGAEPFQRTAQGGFFGGGMMGDGMMMEDAEPVDPGETEAHCWNDLGLVDPEPANEQQIAWLTDYVQQFHDALHTEPLGDYSLLIDVPSFVDHMIINEISRDVDAYVRSSYFHKDRDGLINAGPLWDYNLAFSSVNGGLEGWHFESQAANRGNDDWFLKLGRDPAFMVLFAARWRELRETLLSDESVDARITEIATPLAGAGQRDVERWPNSGVSFGGGGMMMSQDEAPPESWASHVAALREWIPQRMAWIDAEVASL